jgi:chromosome segregation ATPase
MNNLQQNLLIVVALSLCGLCVYQWSGQTRQRVEIEKLEDMVYQKAAAIQGYTNSIHDMDAQIAHMDARITELKAKARTNADLILSQRRSLNGLQLTAAALTNELAQYKAAVTNLEGKLKVAYAGIEKQNAAMKDLVAQRDQFVRKYNDEVKDRNDVVSKYNELVRQVQTNQTTSAKP